MTNLDPSDMSSTQNFHGADIVDARVLLDAFGLPLMRPFWSHLMLSSHNEPRAQISGTTVSIFTTDGALYQLQSSTNLMTWQNEGSAQTGTGSTLNTTVNQSGERRFWRWSVMW